MGSMKGHFPYLSSVVTLTEYVACKRVSIGDVAYVVKTGTTELVPYHVVKSLQLIWCSGTRRFHLRVPDLQMCCSDLT